MSRSALLSLMTKLGLASTKCGSWYPLAMESTVILSPPTSEAMEARSDVVAMTLRAAEAGDAARMPPRIAAIERLRMLIEFTPSEGMGAVGADREEKLEEGLVGGDARGVRGAAELAARLAELARPVREDEGSALVDERGIGGALGAVDAHAPEPPARELVVERRVASEGAGRRRRRVRAGAVAESIRRGAGPEVSMAPHELGPRRQPPVDRAPQRAVAQGQVDADEPRVEAGHGVDAGAPREGPAEVEVGGLGEIAIAAEASDEGEVAARGGPEQVGRLAAVDLRDRLQ